MKFLYAKNKRGMMMVVSMENGDKKEKGERLKLITQLATHQICRLTLINSVVCVFN